MFTKEAITTEQIPSTFSQTSRMVCWKKVTDCKLARKRCWSGHDSHGRARAHRLHSSALLAADPSGHFKELWFTERGAWLTSFFRQLCMCVKMQLLFYISEYFTLDTYKWTKHPSLVPLGWVAGQARIPYDFYGNVSANIYIQILF